MPERARARDLFHLAKSYAKPAERLPRTEIARLVAAYEPDRDARRRLWRRVTRRMARRQAARAPRRLTRR